MAEQNKVLGHGFKIFAIIGKLAVRFRWLVIIFWLVAVPLSIHYFPSIGSVEKNDVSDFLPKSSPTNVGAKLESAFQRKDTASSATIIISKSTSQLDSTDNTAILQLETNVKHVAEVTEIRNLGTSADGKAQQLVVGVSGAAFGQKVTDIVSNIRQEIKKTPLPSGLHANLTGDLAASVDQQNANNQGRNKTEGYTVLLILVLLLLVFRSALAPLVTLFPAGLALALSQPVIAEATKIGVQVGFITQILLIVLLLGAGTDYGLFLVFRVREELRKGLEPKDAVVEALLHVGESITFSAATVVAALLSLLLASFGLYKGLGPALAIGLVIMLLIALTFLPALLAVLGRAVFWPSKTTKREPKIGLWGKVASKAIKKPVLMMCLGVIVFGGLMLGLVGYEPAGFGNQNPPAASDSAKGQAALVKHFPAANNNPDLLVLHFPQSVWNNPSVIAKVQSELSASSNYSAVSGPLNLNGLQLTTDQLAQIHQGGGQTAQALDQFISQDGKTLQYYGVLKAGPAGSTPALQAIPTVRSELQNIAQQAGADQSSVYGSDSVGYDISHTTNSDLKKIIPVVLIVIAFLLAIMLRSLVAPWYLILTVALSYLASLGFAMIVFVHLGDQEGLNFVLPFLLFIFGMALGEDYNILVMSRIREEAHNTSPLSAAVTKAIGITGTTVTSAGLILAGTFTILGIVGGNSQVQQIGFGVAFAILLDTFFVRTLLVPSIVAMLGRWNWWPSHLYRSEE